jgi:hypothetical protein
MKQGRLINFELLWDTDINVNVVLPKILDLEFQQAVTDGVTTIIGLFLMEGILPHDSHNQQLFLEIKKLSDKYNLEVIILSGLGESFNNQYTIENGSILNNLPFEVIYTSYHLRMSFNIINEITIEPKENNKFLFLGGIANRLNRIYLLSKLYENNLLTNGEWSFFIPESQEDQNICRNLLSHYSDEEYETFLKKCTRAIDKKYKEMINFIHDGNRPYKEGDLEHWSKIVHTSFWNNPMYIDPKVYNETSLSIIAEGPNYWTTDYCDFITEKTWRTIIYKHPFIFAGHPEQFKYIKQIGFETFEKYMLIQDYALVENEKERIELIVKNVDHFLKHQTYHKTEIQKDVEHNYNLFLKLANDQNCLLTSLKSKYNIPDDEFSKFFSTNTYKHLIRSIDDIKGLV